MDQERGKPENIMVITDSSSEAESESESEFSDGMEVARGLGTHGGGRTDLLDSPLEFVGCGQPKAKEDNRSMSLTDSSSLTDIAKSESSKVSHWTSDSSSSPYDYCVEDGRERRAQSVPLVTARNPIEVGVGAQSNVQVQFLAQAQTQAQAMAKLTLAQAQARARAEVRLEQTQAENQVQAQVRAQMKTRDSSAKLKTRPSTAPEQARRKNTQRYLLSRLSLVEKRLGAACNTSLAERLNVELSQIRRKLANMGVDLNVPAKTAVTPKVVLSDDSSSSLSDSLESMSLNDIQGKTTRNIVLQSDGDNVSATEVSMRLLTYIGPSYFFKPIEVSAKQSESRRYEDSPTMDEVQAASQPLTVARLQTGSQLSTGSQPSTESLPSTGSPSSICSQSSIESELSTGSESSVGSESSIGRESPIVCHPSIGGHPSIANQSMIGSQPSAGNQPLIGSQLWTGNHSLIGNQLWTGNQSLIGNQLWTGNQSMMGNQLWTGNQSYIGIHPSIANQSLIESQPWTGNQSLIGSQPWTGNQSLIGSQPWTGNQSLIGSQPWTGNQSLIGSQPWTGNQSLIGSQPSTGAQSLIGNQPSTGNQSLIGSQSLIESQTSTGTRPSSPVAAKDVDRNALATNINRVKKDLRLTQIQLRTRKIWINTRLDKPCTSREANRLNKELSTIEDKLKRIEAALDAAVGDSDMDLELSTDDDDPFVYKPKSVSQYNTFNESGFLESTRLDQNLSSVARDRSSADNIGKQSDLSLQNDSGINSLGVKTDGNQKPPMQQQPKSGSPVKHRELKKVSYSLRQKQEKEQERKLKKKANTDNVDADEDDEESDDVTSSSDSDSEYSDEDEDPMPPSKKNRPAYNLRIN